LVVFLFFSYAWPSFSCQSVALGKIRPDSL
jgi:hypothetical protein